MRQRANKSAFAVLASVLMAPPCAAQDFFPPGGEHRTSTPIKHLVVIFGENISFDHYFGTYPTATNPHGAPFFAPLPFTPPVNGFTFQLLNNSPNKNNPANGTGANNPFRLDRTQAVTADQNDDYKPEQQAFDDGKMDLFYDGNTATALWNYAQHFALNDNSYGSPVRSVDGRRGQPRFGPDQWRDLLRRFDGGARQDRCDGVLHSLDEVMLFYVERETKPGKWYPKSRMARSIATTTFLHSISRTAMSPTHRSTAKR
jgi:hypothetical protein